MNTSVGLCLCAHTKCFAQTLSADCRTTHWYTWRTHTQPSLKLFVVEHTLHTVVIVTHVGARMRVSVCCIRSTHECWSEGVKYAYVPGVDPIVDAECLVTKTNVSKALVRAVCDFHVSRLDHAVAGVCCVRVLCYQSIRSERPQIR